VLRRIARSTTLPGSRAGCEDESSADRSEIERSLSQPERVATQQTCRGSDVIRPPSSIRSACSDVDER
jgi:hypothetical protein